MAVSALISSGYMGANESVPQQEQKDPVYKFFEDPMRALGLVSRSRA